MGEFKSLVVLDLETSGLPCNGGRTKVTELCIAGMLRDHLNDACRKGDALPRVIHKLNVCFYPKKMIHYEATEMTGLDNLLLEELPSWDEGACVLLTTFLQRLPPPVCVVAHNGTNFDFQILKSEITAQGQLLSDDIMWTDSLLAFKNLIPHLSTIRPLDHSLSETCPNVMPTSLKSPQLSFIAANASSENVVSMTNLITTKNVQEINETTPKRGTLISNAPPRKKRASNDEAHQSCTTANINVRKQLFISDSRLRSYKLTDIHHYFYGTVPPVSHNAESDVITLTKCIIALSPEIFSYFDQNFSKFSQILPKW